MMQGPRRTPLILVSAAMLALPAVLLIACCFLALYEMAGGSGAGSSPSGPAWLGTVLFPVPAALLVMAENRAIRRRDAKAAAWVAGLCLWFPVVGSIGWIEGLLCLSGVLSRNRHWHSWADFGIYSAFLAYMAFAGFGHLHWWRVLRTSTKVEAVAWDA